MCVCLLEGLPSFTLEEPLLLTAWASVTDVILEWRKCPGEPEILRNCLEPVGTQRRLVCVGGTYPRPGHTGAGAPRPRTWALHPSSLSISELVWPRLCHLDLAEGQVPKMSFGENQMGLGTALKAAVFCVTASQKGKSPTAPLGSPPGLRRRCKVVRPLPPGQWGGNRAWGSHPCVPGVCTACTYPGDPLLPE